MTANSGSAALSSPSMFQIARRLCGSRPVVGSSRNSTGGEWRTPRAISSRRRIPPESWPAFCLRRSESPTCSSRRAMRCDRVRPRDRTSFPERRGFPGRSGSRRSLPPGRRCRSRSARPPFRARCYDRGCVRRPTWEEEESSACGSMSSCPRRWARAGRTSPRAARRRKPRRPRRNPRNAWSTDRLRSRASTGAQPFPASITNVCPEITPFPSGCSRTEKVFRSRLWSPSSSWSRTRNEA